MYLALERYSRPEGIEQCLKLLAEPEQRTALLAGGTDLNVSGHEELTHVIDLQALSLDRIDADGDGLRLGACVTLSQLQRHDLLQGPWFSALRQAAGALANVGIQNRSTLGGRIVVDRADQDLPPALAVLGARLRLFGLAAGKLSERVIDFPIGAQPRTALDGGLVAEVLLPISSGRSALRRFGRSAVDVPLACCAASQEGNTFRLAAALQGPGAAGLKRLSGAEQLLGSWEGSPPDGWRQTLRDALLTELASYDNAWASGSYRQDLSATLMLRAVAEVMALPELDSPGQADEEGGS